MLKKKEFTCNTLGFSFRFGAFRVVFQFSSQTTNCIMKPDVLMYFILLWGGAALVKHQIHQEPAAPFAWPSAASCHSNSQQKDSSSVGCWSKLTILTSLLKRNAV